MKIIVALLIPILLGIVVGSNLLPMMTVVILNQPTVALPIGVWLAIAIGLGLLSSSLIQFLIFLDRRSFTRQIRQLQSRLQQQDQDIFTYTSPVTESDRSVRDKPANSQAKTSRFSSYQSQSANQFTSKSSTTPIIVDDKDDWAVEPESNRQLDWEDSIPPRQQNFQPPNHSSEIENAQIYPDRRTQTIKSELNQTRKEVYDADFRLIQPPYKEPIETEFDDDLESADFEYTEIDEDFDSSSSSVKSPLPNHATPSSNLDDEDWGFDFDNRDTPVRTN